MLSIESANTNITVKAMVKTEKEQTLKTHPSWYTYNPTTAEES